MQKRGKERGLPWWNNLLVLVLMSLAAGAAFFVTNRDPSSASLKYGELKQILQSPGVSFQNVKVEPGEIRGEIVTRDAVSAARKTASGHRPLPFAPRGTD